MRIVIMKKSSKIILAFLCIVLLASCQSKRIEKVTSSDSLYVRKIENLSDDFIMGMDVSSLLSLENSGVVYHDYDGSECDLLKVLAESGINTIRLRVWNDPYDENGKGYGGGNCDINTAVEIGKRASQYGMKVIIDFHYSDFWADPSKQMVPKAWKNMDIESKADALYEYTKDSLKKLKDNKVNVTMVQLGNETNNGMAGETIWMNVIYHLMSAGSKAIREVFPKALIAVHFANPENGDQYLDKAKKLDYYSLDYDVFATSYYPYWHGSLENLTNVLNKISETYHKKTLIVETSYAYTDVDQDFFANTISSASAVTKSYPYSIQGQANCILDIIDTAANQMKDCLGVVYWEGAWIPVGTSSYEENLKKWEEFGSGWASSFAASYDPEDAGKYYGGSAVDNQAFFDANGNPLESLKLFALCRNGNEVELQAESIEDAYVECDITKPIELPTLVHAVMSDNSKKQIDVVWESFDENQLKSHGIGEYLIKGKAGALDAVCHLSLIEYNYLVNHSFEDDGDKTSIPNGWSLIKHKEADELYVETKKTDSLSGENHYHFWSKGNDSVEFELEQEVKDLSEGNYKFSISIMGGDGGDQEIYAYVKIGDQIIAKDPMKITSYNQWDTGLIEQFHYDGASVLKVGIYVKCAGQGNGAWGKIDDAMLNAIGGQE